jgi:CRP-like cAMP-binding protein
LCNFESKNFSLYFREGEDVKNRLECVLASQYVTNQARNIVRYFANINVDGFVFVSSQDIANSTDLARSTIFRHINELRRKGLIYIHKCRPYSNVYELTF